MSQSGCDSIVTLVLTVPKPLELNITQTNVTCKDAYDGTATANVTGGTQEGKYLYKWTIDVPGTIIGYDTVKTITTGPGTYSLVARDSVYTECAVYDTVTITEPDLLVSTITDYNTNCFGKDDGTIDLTESRICPTAPTK